MVRTTLEPHLPMSYLTLRSCVDDLLRTGQMVRVVEPVDTYLEVAAIQRRIFASGGPALFFQNIHNHGKPCRFPMVSNMYGTMARMEYIFRDTIPAAREAIRWGADFPGCAVSLAKNLRIFRRENRDTSFFTSLRQLGTLARSAWVARPKQVRRAKVMKNSTILAELPQLVSWPQDGGPFITLPQVYTESPLHLGTEHGNLGMYRVQIAGNEYVPNREAGLHYQISRGIAAHHAEAIQCGKPLQVQIFVGGAPAMTLAAVMPFPPNVCELTIAGILANSRIPMYGSIYSEADFCITGTLSTDRTLPEGPFGDHLGYYSLSHPFPVLTVENVWHRDGAIWPFTVVGRPPQEDSMFGRFLHELTGSAIPKTLPGISAVHAVDEAGVHPLLLAIGTEQYRPYRSGGRAAELLTHAHKLLGFGQLSLAKYLFIAAQEDDPTLSVYDTIRFLEHILRRVDWRYDLHFCTETTMDTLDYTSPPMEDFHGLQDAPLRGSKLIIAARGQSHRKLATSLDGLTPYSAVIPEEFHRPRLAMPGVCLFESRQPSLESLATLGNQSDNSHGRLAELADVLPLWVVVDDTAKVSTIRDFLWTTFTKSDPATDVYGIGAFYRSKHWGCTGPLVIDARRKHHHAPELEEDTAVTAAIRRFAVSGASLHGILDV